MDIAPPLERLNSLYPASYGFIRDPVNAPAAHDGGWKTKLKIAILKTHYRYPAAELGAVWGFVGWIAGWLTGSRAGFEVGFLPFRRGGRLLEVGPGNGDFLMRMRLRGWTVTGLEPDAGACAVLRRAGVETLEGTLEQLDLPEEHYHAVVLHHAFEHLLDAGDAALKLANSLAPGGRLVSVSPNPRGLGAQRYGRFWTALDVPRHLVLPSEMGYRRLLGMVGLRVRTRTDARLARWILPASGALERQHNATSRRKLPLAALRAFAMAPGLGEEVICIGVKP